ncbi:MAG: hypothetical protein LBJ65_04960 [Burkholderia sp.]|uniref:GLUG motif-containing protein n=1 Tax=Burkholderia sp. TaxID=36773 RepID=UPI0028316D56|nr:GLUG motif-containing protein [Burkholderia sp.]MDR0240939.1 hypothetical protein [Burkholderia sp.]
MLHTVDDLRGIDNNLSGRYVLGNTIDGRGARFRSIGGDNPLASAFNGTLDGLGNTVARLNIFNTAINVGLFSLSRGSIGNLVLDSLAIAAPSNIYGGSVGGLVGSTHGGRISNVTAKNMNVSYSGSDWTFVGGLVGYHGSGTIERARFDGKVAGGAGTFATGGLAGVNLGTIRDSHVLANTVVTGIGDARYMPNLQNVGGLVGINRGTLDGVSSSGRLTARDNLATGGLVGNNHGGAIRNASSNMAVSAGKGGVVGGLIGLNRDDGQIDNVYAAGSVTTTGGGAAGGLVGENANGAIRNASATGAVSGGRNGDVGGFAGRNLADGTIANSDATGAVATNGAASTGGFVGNNGGKLEHVLSNNTVTDLASKNVGGLAGINSGAIEYAQASGAVKAGNASHTGGLVGLNTGTIDSSKAEGSVTAGLDSRTGGLVGTNRGDNAVIRDSSASGGVTAQRSEVGGLVGQNEKRARIIASSSSGAVHGERSNLGGLVGTNDGTVTASISSATIGKQTLIGWWQRGGLVGWNNGTVESSATSGPASKVNIIGLNLGQMIDTKPLEQLK